MKINKYMKIAHCFLLLSFFLSSCSLFEKKEPIEIRGKREDVLDYIPKTLPDKAKNKGKIADISKQERDNNGNRFLNLLDKNEVLEILSFKNKSSLGLSGTPIFQNDVIYLLDSDGIVKSYHLQAKKAILLWQSKIATKDKFYYSGGLTLHHNTLLVTDGSNMVAAIDCRNGHIKWHKQFSSYFRKAPLIIANNILLQSANNSIFYLKSNNGEVIWNKFNNNDEIQAFSTNSVGNDKTIVASDSIGGIKAINSSDGSNIWSLDPLNLEVRETKDFISNLPISLKNQQIQLSYNPILAQNYIYTMTANGAVISLNIKNGDVLWHENYFVFQPMWLSGELLFAINHQNTILAIDKNNGAMIWNYQLPCHKDKNKWSSPIIAANMLITARNDGLIMFFDGESGKLQQSFKCNYSGINSLTVSNGSLYAMTNNGKILRISVAIFK